MGLPRWESGEQPTADRVSVAQSHLEPTDLVLARGELPAQDWPTWDDVEFATRPYRHRDGPWLEVPRRAVHASTLLDLLNEMEHTAIKQGVLTLEQVAELHQAIRDVVGDLGDAVLVPVPRPPIPQRHPTPRHPANAAPPWADQFGQLWAHRKTLSW